MKGTFLFIKLRYPSKTTFNSFLNVLYKLWSEIWRNAYYESTENLIALYHLPCGCMHNTYAYIWMRWVSLCAGCVWWDVCSHITVSLSIVCSHFFFALRHNSTYCPPGVQPNKGPYSCIPHEMRCFSGGPLRANTTPKPPHGASYERYVVCKRSPSTSDVSFSLSHIVSSLSSSLTRTYTWRRIEGHRDVYH